MGWASFAEDIADRLADDLEQMSRTISRPDITPAQLRRDFWNWSTRAQELLRNLHQHLELATDPAIDLVHEVIQLRSREEASKRDIELARTTVQRAQADREATRKKLETANEELKQEKRKNRELTEENEQLLRKLVRDKPEDLYADYDIEDLREKYR